MVFDDLGSPKPDFATQQVSLGLDFEELFVTKYTKKMVYRSVSNDRGHVLGSKRCHNSIRCTLNALIFDLTARQTPGFFWDPKKPWRYTLNGLAL